MDRTTINPWTWQDMRGFAQAVRVTDPHETVYVSGQCSVDGDGQVVKPDDMAGQLAQALDNVETVLADADMTLADVVRYDIYTTDVDAYVRAAPVLGERFGAHGRFPAGGILAGVSRLAMPGLLVEVVATAAR